MIRRYHDDPEAAAAAAAEMSRSIGDVVPEPEPSPPKKVVAVATSPPQQPRRAGAVKFELSPESQNEEDQWLLKYRVMRPTPTAPRPEYVTLANALQCCLGILF